MTSMIKSWQVNYKDYRLECYWQPGTHLSSRQLLDLMADINHVNAAEGRLNYGFFDRSWTRADRKAFMDESVWCLIYRDDKPCGFVSQYLLGEVDGKMVIHFGLVKLLQGSGKDFIRVPYVALALGNLLNYGPHFASNISHVPAIVDMFGNMASNLYPSFEQQETERRQTYKPILQLLTERYIVPVLGYDPASICPRSYSVKDSLKDSESGFETDWRLIPKSSSTLCNLFVKDWLNVRDDGKGVQRVTDDLIQIGTVDYSYLANPHMHSINNELEYGPSRKVTGKVTRLPLAS